MILTVLNCFIEIALLLPALKLHNSKSHRNETNKDLQQQQQEQHQGEQQHHQEEEEGEGEEINPTTTANRQDYYRHQSQFE